MSDFVNIYTWHAEAHENTQTYFNKGRFIIMCVKTRDCKCHSYSLLQYALEGEERGREGSKNAIIGVK